MINFRILLYISVVVSCVLIAIVFGTNQETVTDQIRSKFDVKSDENVILLTTENERYTKLLLALSDEEIDKITANSKTRDKILVICSKAGHDRLGIKSSRIRVQSHSLPDDIIELPELFARISENTPLNEKIRRSTPLMPLLNSGEEKNLASPFLSSVRQNEKDRLRLVQVLTFAFAKHQDF
jgi:hypothetical protein